MRRTALTFSIGLEKLGRDPRIPVAVPSITTPHLYLLPSSSSTQQVPHENKFFNTFALRNCKVFMNSLRASLAIRRLKLGLSESEQD